MVLKIIFPDISVVWGMLRVFFTSPNRLWSPSWLCRFQIVNIKHVQYLWSDILLCVGNPEDSRWRSHVGKNDSQLRTKLTEAWLHPSILREFLVQSSAKTNIANSSCLLSSMFVYTKVTFDHEGFFEISIFFSQDCCCSWMESIVCGVLFWPNRCSPYTIGTKLFNLT